MKTETLSPPPRPPKDGAAAHGLGDSNDGPNRSSGWLMLLKLAVLVLIAATTGYVAGHFLHVW